MAGPPWRACICVVLQGMQSRCQTGAAVLLLRLELMQLLHSITASTASLPSRPGKGTWRGQYARVFCLQPGHHLLHKRPFLLRGDGMPLQLPE